MNRLKSMAASLPGGQTFRFVSAAILVLAAIAGAADNTPWKSKPSQQWDDNDIHRVLFESPWVHIAMVSATWRTAGDDTTGLPAGSSPPAANPGGVAQGGGRSEGTSSLSVAEVGSQRGEFPTAQYFVDWVSSKTMRAARAQYDVLHSDKTQADAEKYASEPQANYVILVQGGDMRPFLRDDEKFFQANAFLQLKKAGRKVSPERVEYQRGADGKAVVGALFFFARQLPSGDALIPLDEKGIEFTCKLGKSNLKASFEPQKMTGLAGPDL
jgi:hypothetical protein